MLRHAIHHGEGRFRFVVLQGASYQDEFAYREELEAASARHPELLVYIPTVSRPGEERNRGWAGATGRVNAVVEAHVERLGLPAESTAAYACGRITCNPRFSLAVALATTKPRMAAGRDGRLGLILGRYVNLGLCTAFVRAIR